jgi:serine/threonine protein kinase
MAQQSRDIKLIFAEALEKQTSEERAAYLDATCGNDEELLRKVEALLTAYEEATDVPDSPIIDLGPNMEDMTLTEQPGTVIGRYKLLEKIGEGGMAVVYMAEQETPIRRKVALKIIKLGMDTKTVIARFEAERQALAMMDHPNIAKVLDAGATETGRPYFVMELVKGVSITDYCDANSLSTKERLELFIQVCNAVQHAHQKGIIHRDIKPTNVMVTLHDGKPVPKVIDFGIAKAINQKLTEKTLFTRYAHIIGTPAYMSPEQAELSDLDIDTRTDIYSLGVLLYELLTGTTPFGEEELRKAGYIEMQRVIREQEPVKPSTKLSTLGKILTDIAKHRNSTPDLLRKAIRGDLDLIVMKSLEKDRTRRYETTNGLALDIRRHIEHEPVVARGPSTTYRFQKFLRRHHSQAIAALAMVVIAGSVIVILSMWNRDRLQLTEAEGFRHRGILSQAREQYARADREAALETIKPILNSRHVGSETRLLYASILVDNRHFDEAVTLLGNLLSERPEIAGAAHSLLARIIWESESPNAEKLKEIEEHQRQAEALLPETAEAYFLRAMTAVTIKEQLGSLDKALQLDPAHYESRRLRAFTYYASRKYEKMKDDALGMIILRPRDPLGYSLHAIAWRQLGRYQEAIADYDNAIVLTPKKNPEYIDLSVQRCETLLRMGDYERIITDAQECLKLLPDRPAFQYHTFSALVALGQYDKAADLFWQIISPSQEARQQFQDWCAKYVFDTLEAGRSWHPQDREPAGAAFLPMVEAEETYHSLSDKARPLVTNGFSGQWSPDGTKFAFSLGVHGYSGVAIFDSATKETDLLIAPGKDPVWSPDGKYIAFVRDRQGLRLEELATAARWEQQSPWTDEEVWVIKADGTEPRLLVRGGWPSWSQDSKSIYYQSRVDNTLCSISIDVRDAKPNRIMACSGSSPSVSPDNQHVAYFEGGSLKITDLLSQTLGADCAVPLLAEGDTGWSPTGKEVCLGGSNVARQKIGLWIYDLARKELLRVLDGQIQSACWSPRATELAFCLGPPYHEIWAANLDPNIPTIEALGRGRTLREHYREMLDFYTQRIKADPMDADAYLRRAQQYHFLHEDAKVNRDMGLYSAILTQGSLPDLGSGMVGDIEHVINGPFNYQFIFSAERPVNKIPLLNVALGQKGRCNMTSFKIPILSTCGLAMSLFGFCLLSGMDTPPAHADFTFGPRVNPGPAVNSPQVEGSPIISRDGLELYFYSTRPGSEGGYVTWRSKRASAADPWGPPENLGLKITAYVDSISSDGLTMYLDWSNGIYTATRPAVDAPWGSPVRMDPPINLAVEYRAIISPDDLELYFASTRAGSIGMTDIYVSTRLTRNDPWGTPVNLGPTINTAGHEHPSAISPDGLVLFFIATADHPGGLGGIDTWMTRRSSKGAVWSAPVNLGPSFNTPGDDALTSVSVDGHWAYAFGTTEDVCMAPILPIVDFNGDGIVNIADVAIMLEHWHTDYSLCDIGPFPWGDGFVDAQDLSVLAEHLFEDYRLVAHWALDEDAGNTAYDSTNENDATLQGGPIWQPEGGKLGGSLQLDGTNDYVSTPFILDPAKESFSVFAWIKGGAPGQVIISQNDETGTRWLWLDSSYGRLISWLMHPPFDPLMSESSITDGQWHHVGLVYDIEGLHRYLYVDGAQATRDIDFVAGVGSNGGLYIGAGSDLEPGTFFSGLIDDVRIYNQALSAEEIATLAQ